MPNTVVFKWRGWISAGILVPAIVAACLSEPRGAEGGLVDICFDFGGWLVLGAGVFMRLWATLYIGGRKSVALVTDGPYAFCRHPLYVGSFLIVLALAIFMQSLLVAVATLALAVFYWCVILPSEEQHVAEALGEAYRRYCEKTGRLWPRSLALGRPGRVEIKMGEFLREFARTYVFLSIGAATELFAYCRQFPWWPKLFHAL